ncbi:MAG: c-type cytochrome, partial [Lysobacter sp.]
MTRSFLFIASLVLLGSTQTTALAADGKALYETTCVACHGPKAQGTIPGVPDLAKSKRLAKPDAELVTNILNGFQSKGSPMAMP